MNQVEFTPPKNSLPEGAQPNEDFDMVCSFRAKSDGQICMTKFGDHDMPYDKGEKKPGYGDYVQGMKQSMANEEPGEKY